jgi:hypothetical protein
MGEVPLGQLTSQWSTWSMQKTWQSPKHLTTQLVALLQLIMLLGPARRPQRCMLKQL